MENNNLINNLVCKNRKARVKILSKIIAKIREITMATIITITVNKLLQSSHQNQRKASRHRL